MDGDADRRARALFLECLFRHPSERADFVREPGPSDPERTRLALGFLNDDHEGFAGVEMDDARRTRLEIAARDLFLAALDLKSDERAAYFDSTAVEQPGATARAEELIEASLEPDDALEALKAKMAGQRQLKGGDE